MKGLVALVAAVSLAATFVISGTGPAEAARVSETATSPAETSGTGGYDQKITWSTCENPTLQHFNAECAYISVPLNYQHPRGSKIQLAVSRISHTTPDSQYQGVMLVNPGGPGGSGLALSILGQFVPNGAGNAYDWIGFDPRGVGSSKPSISCQPDYFSGDRPDYIPRTKALEGSWLARSEAYAADCSRNAGTLLNNMTTVDSAKDMESIRAALGARQINYYGFSYGTYLGQVYSTLYPQRIRRMVLDSNVDPRKVAYQANLDQDVAFERNIKIWFGWLAAYDSEYHLGATADAVEQVFYAAQDKLRQKPAGGVVGPDEWADIFLYAGYYQQTWLDLGAAFAGWVHDGDAAAVISQYQSADAPGDDNAFAVYNAVQCTDVQWPQSWEKWRRDNWRTYQIAPFFTWGNAWYNAPCLFWAAKASTPIKIDGSKVAGALLIDETLDAATPFEGSLEVRARFPKSSLIAEPDGSSHADSLFGNACVDDQIAAYLATGALPARQPGRGPDTLCAPLARPDPTASTVTVSSATVSSAATSLPVAALLDRGPAVLMRALSH